MPFALALGVSDQWAKKFEGLFDYHPTWYVDPAHAYFNVVLFNSVVSNFDHNFQGAMIAATSKAAGAGGSGMGGGGFSGGGFGGGGGGSW